jgi:hypothetical protein
VTFQNTENFTVFSGGMFSWENHSITVAKLPGLPFKLKGNLPSEILEK